MARRTENPGLFASLTTEPLAARMRPRTLDEYIGQDRIIGPGRLLRRAIQADRLSSVIFYGPPGTGKTTLARVIANSTMARFITINAVLSGVKEIREAVAAAQAARQAGARTILFVDEVHRFNKAQQDALLPWVENGTLILIGATTENPYFEVNKALVSRSRLFELTPLTETELRAVALQALNDAERGYGGLDVVLEEDALAHLVNVANGDARALLNALELAVETTKGEDGRVVITREVAEESIQRRAVLYDKEGDAHFDTISAFIKSIRGSDPDAALYWLAKMVYAGEDPRFIFRRLIILASEDVGMADPGAAARTVGAAQAFDYVGLPEGRFHLAQATLDLATAPKSNTTMGFFDALSAVASEVEAEVPNHLKDGSRDAEALGHGAGYAYPHAYKDHWVAQQYLPAALQGRVFYEPSGSGHEALIRSEVARRREAQLAAMLEADAKQPGVPFFVAPIDRERDRWLERVTSQAGERLSVLRDALMVEARLEPHHVVLDLRAASGLLTFEALRLTPRGQVWALEADERAAKSLEERAAPLDELTRPVIVHGTLSGFSLEQAGGVRFDLVIGMNALGSYGGEPTTFFGQLRGLLGEGGRVALAEQDGGRAQRLHALLELGGVGELGERLKRAEEAIYERGADREPLVRLSPSLEVATESARAAGFTVEATRTLDLRSRVLLNASTVASWFASGTGRPTYAELIGEELSRAEVSAAKELFEAQLVGREVEWLSPNYLLVLTT